MRVRMLLHRAFRLHKEKVKLFIMTNINILHRNNGFIIMNDDYDYNYVRRLQNKLSIGHSY